MLRKQSAPSDKTVGLKAQTTSGVLPQAAYRESENVSVKVDDAVDKSSDSQDVGPAGHARLDYSGENNVIDRLEEADW